MCQHSVPNLVPHPRTLSCYAPASMDFLSRRFDSVLSSPHPTRSPPPPQALLGDGAEEALSSDDTPLREFPPALATDGELRLPWLGEAGSDEVEKRLELAVAAATRMHGYAVDCSARLETGRGLYLSLAQRNRRLSDSVASLKQALDSLRESHAKVVADLEARLDAGDPQDEEERARYVQDLEREIAQWRRLGESGANHAVQPVVVKAAAIPPSGGGEVATTSSEADTSERDREAAKQLEQTLEECSRLGEQNAVLKEQLRRADQARAEAVERAAGLELQTVEQNTNIDRLFDESLIHLRRLAELEREVNEMSNNEAELQGKLSSLERKEAALREAVEAANARLEAEQAAKTKLQRELAEKGEVYRKAMLRAAEGLSLSPAVAPTPPSDAQPLTPPLTSTTRERWMNAFHDRRKLYTSTAGHRRVVLSVFVVVATTFYFFTSLAVFGGGGVGHGLEAEIAPRWAMEAIRTCEGRLKSMREHRVPLQQEEH